MKTIQIVCYDRGWILEAMAKQWVRDLSVNQGKYDVKLSYNFPEEGSDIYVHFIFFSAVIVPKSINIVLVTHIDHWWKAFSIISLSRANVNFISMSRQTQHLINRYTTLSNAYYYSPSSIHFHIKENNIVDSIVFGLFFKVHPDGRKNNDAIKKLFTFANHQNKKCKLILYGKGFKDIASQYTNMSVDIFEDDFEVTEYSKKLKECDYVIYFGYDEGAVSILDAATLSIPVIATRQGYHLDIELSKGSMLCDSADEVVSAIKNICNAVSDRSEDKLLINIFNQISLLNNVVPLWTYLNVFIVKNDFIRNAKHVKEDILIFYKFIIKKLREFF